MIEFNDGIVQNELRLDKPSRWLHADESNYLQKLEFAKNLSC